MRLGVDPKHADQMVRGTVVMPNGLGKSKKVLVIAGGDKQREAQEAGAAAVRTNEETWLENQEKNTRLRSSRSKRAIIPSNRQFLFSRRSSLPNSTKP